MQRAGSMKTTSMKIYQQTVASGGTSFNEIWGNQSGESSNCLADVVLRSLS